MAERSFKPAYYFSRHEYSIDQQHAQLLAEIETSTMAKRDHTRDYSKETLFGVPRLAGCVREAMIEFPENNPVRFGSTEMFFSGSLSWVTALVFG